MDSVIHFFRDILSGKTYVITVLVCFLLIIFSLLQIMNREVKIKTFFRKNKTTQNFVDSTNALENSQDEVVMMNESSVNHSVYRGDSVNIDNVDHHK